MSSELPTPGQVSAEERERTEASSRSSRVPPTPGSRRCAGCHGPVLRFPSGLLRCVDEGIELAADATYVQGEA